MFSRTKVAVALARRANSLRKEGMNVKNWKTSILGLLAGITGTSAVGWTKPDGSVNWISVGLGLALTVLGYLAKDHNVTGGTERQ